MAAAMGHSPQALNRKSTDMSDKVPLFKSWTGWYILVLVFLVVLIGLFYLFTKNFA